MLTLLLLGTSYVVTVPPVLPPKNPQTSYGREEWKLVQVGLMEADELFTHYSKSYEGTRLSPDFTCNPIQDTKLPQGIIGLQYKDVIHLLMHYVEEEGYVFSIRSIATPYNLHRDAIKYLSKHINANEALCVHTDFLKAYQIKWYMTLKFHGVC